MLALGAKNPIGGVVHLITGPETELFMDIHGAMLVPIAEILKNFEGTDTVFISVTRCKSELATQMMLKNAGISFIASFNPSDGSMGVSEPNKSIEAKPEVKKTIERCKYCKREAELLPVPGFKICTVCAQIELGIAKTSKEKRTTAGHEG